MEVIVEQHQLTTGSMVYQYENNKYNIFVLDRTYDVLIRRSSKRIPALLQTIRSLKNGQYLVVTCVDQDDHSDLILRQLRIPGKPSKYWIYLAQKIRGHIAIIDYKTSTDNNLVIRWTHKQKQVALPKEIQNIIDKEEQKKIEKETNALAKANRVPLMVTIGMNAVARLQQSSIAQQLGIDIVHYDSWSSASAATSDNLEYQYICFTKPHLVSKEVLISIKKCDLLYLANAHGGKNRLVEADKFGMLSIDAISTNIIPSDPNQISSRLGYMSNVHLALDTKNKKYRDHYLYPDLPKIASIVYVSEVEHENTIKIAIDSIYRQSYPQSRLTLIVVIDPEQSNTNTVTNTFFTLEGLAKKNKNMKIISNSEHLGFYKTIDSVIADLPDEIEYISVSTGNTISVKNRFVNDILVGKNSVQGDFESIDNPVHILDKLSYQKYPKFKISQKCYCNKPLLTIKRNTVYDKVSAHQTNVIAGYFINGYVSRK